MMSPKSTTRWQGLRAKKLSGRTAPEDMEYRKLQMKHNANALVLDELKWKVELAEAMLALASSSNDLMQRLNSIINSQVGDDQKPFTKKGLHDFVTAFAARIKREQQEQSHTKPLGRNSLHDNESPNGNNPG